MMRVAVLWAAFTLCTVSGITPMGLGGYHTAVLKSDGTVWTTGYDAQGELGDGGNTNRGTFGQVLAGAQAVATGDHHSAVLQTDGTVWTAGADWAYMLGDGGDETDRGTFGEVLAGAQAVACGGGHTAALRSDGTVWTVGKGKHGQLGDTGTLPGTARSTFLEVLAGAQAVALGRKHSGVLMSDGTVWTTGEDGSGELGDGGGNTNSGTFKEVLAGAQAVALGWSFTAVLRSDGTVWTTGIDAKGQLGDGGADSNRGTLAEVLAGAQAVACGAGHAAVLMNDGTVWTTGSDESGELGDGGGNTNRGTFGEVLAGAQAVALGAFHTAVLMNDGTVSTAGQGSNGQLGDGSNTERGTFLKVIDDVHSVTSPTAAPTVPPTAALTATTNAGVSAKGDPHLQNINGQRFDLMRPGRHVLLHVPRGADAPHVLLRVEAEVQRLGPQCGDMYFQCMNISGAWVEAKHNGILQFHAGEVGGEEDATWMAFGAVQLKVVRVHWQGIHYLNLFAKHLGRAGFTVGGLLGEDDHTYEATPDLDCVPTLNLHGTMTAVHSAPSSTPPASSAEASLA